MPMIQEELKVQTPEEDLEELYEEGPRRRPWAAIISVVLALAVIFVGYQWHQAAAREQTLASQAHAIRAEVETMRLRAEEAQRDIEALQKKLASLSAEKAALGERVLALGKVAEERAAALRAAERKSVAAAARRVTPVVQKKSR